MEAITALLLAAAMFAQTDGPPAIQWVTEYGTMFYDAHETSSHQFIVAGRKYYSDFARIVFLYDPMENLSGKPVFPVFSLMHTPTG